MKRKVIEQTVILGFILVTANVSQAYSADFVAAKTINGVGEYNFQAGEVIFSDELISFNNDNTSAAVQKCVINIENNGVLKINSDSPWGIVDISSNNLESTYDEIKTVINGDLVITSNIRNSDGRVISLMGGKNTFQVNGSVQIIESVNTSSLSNLWHYGLKANNGSEIIIRDDFTVNSLQGISSEASDSSGTTFVAGVYSDSWSCDGNAGQEKDADTFISLGVDNNDKILLENILAESAAGRSYAYGVLATDGSGTGDKTAVVNLNGNTIIRNLNAVSQIEADVYAIAAERNSVVNVNGDLLIENIGDSSKVPESCERYYNALVASGGTINVNTGANRDRQIKIMGDIAAYNFGGVININFMNSSSYLQGASFTDAGVINMTLENNAVWHLTDRQECGAAEADVNKGNSRITDLTMNNGIVDMYNNDWSMQNLTVDNLEGNGGTFIINTDLQNHKSDTITIKSVSEKGKYKLLAYDPNASSLSGKVFDQEILDAPANNFLLTGGTVEGALYNYRAKLEKVTAGGRTQWKIVGLKDGSEPDDTDEPDDSNETSDKTSTTVKSARSAGAQVFFGWRDNNMMQQRMQKLHHMSDGFSGGYGPAEDHKRQLNDLETDSGIWLQLQRGKNSYNSSIFFEGKYNTYALGFDHKIAGDAKGDWLLGYALTYIDGSGVYSNGGSTYKDLSVDIYTVQRLESGHYLDLNLKLNRTKNDVESHTLTNEKVSSKFKNRGISFGAAYGRRMMISDDGWYLDPQAEITLGRLNGVDYNTDNGVKVHYDHINSIVAGAGLEIGRRLSDLGNVYLRTMVMREFGGNYAVYMTDSNDGRFTENNDLSDSWYEVSLGGDINLGRVNNFYFDVSRSFCADFQKVWQINAGLRWSF